LNGAQKRFWSWCDLWIRRVRVAVNASSFGHTSKTVSKPAESILIYGRIFFEERMEGYELYDIFLEPAIFQAVATIRIPSATAAQAAHSVERTHPGPESTPEKLSFSFNHVLK
jgi:hypothetical protein